MRRRSTPVSVSVVLAARNAEATIREQVDAVLAQRCGAAWELIVVDDASTDRTAEVADRAGVGDLRYRRVSCARHEGASGARREGVAVAGGDLLVFCDADDRVRPGWLSALCRAAEDVDVVGGRCDDATLNSPRVRRRRPPQPGDGLPRAVAGVSYARGGNLAIWRDVYERIGGWDAGVRFGTDVDLCVRAHLAGATIGWTPDAVVDHRHRERWRDTLLQSFRWGVADVRVVRRYGGQLSGADVGRLVPAVGRLLRRRDSGARLLAFGAGRVVGVAGRVR